MIRRLALPAMGIAFINLALLGLLIGMDGASRAYSVGLHTLFRDNLPAVVLALGAVALLAAILGRTLLSTRELWLVIGLVLVADFVAALAITLVFDEMRRFPDIPRAIFTETAGGLQIVAVAAGVVTGYLVGRGSAASGIHAR